MVCWSHSQIRVITMVDNIFKKDQSVSCFLSSYKKNASHSQLYITLYAWVCPKRSRQSTYSSRTSSLGNTHERSLCKRLRTMRRTNHRNPGSGKSNQESTPMSKERPTNGLPNWAGFQEKKQVEMSSATQGREPHVPSGRDIYNPFWIMWIHQTLSSIIQLK